MYSSAGVLIFGHDAALLETRRLVLNRGGFQVWIATKGTEAVEVLLNEPIDLFISASPSPADVCERILETAHTLRPNMINFLLGRESPPPPADKQDIFLALPLTRSPLSLSFKIRSIPERYLTHPRPARSTIQAHFQGRTRREVPGSLCR